MALLVGAFIINNTFVILVAQRTRELALLRAIGASARQVRRSVALEALVIGGLASALGLLAGVGVAQGIQALWRSAGVTLPEGPLVVKASSLGIAFALGVGVTLLSALLPARRAAKVAPVAVMRSVAVERTRPSKVRVGIGVLLAAVSAVALVAGFVGGELPLVLIGTLAGFVGTTVLSPVLARPVVRVISAPLPRLAGMRGRLARENALRNPRRTAATASALMIGVALVGGITVFAASGKWSVSHSFDKEFRGDLVADTGAWIYGGASPRMAEDLGALPEVAAAVPTQMTEAKVGDSVTQLGGWPAATVDRAFDIGVSSGSLAGLGTDGMALGSRWAEGHDLAVGDRLPVVFPGGAKQTFTVRALFDHPDWTGPVWVDRAAFAAAQPDQLDTRVYVTGADGVGAPDLRSAVEAVTAAYASVEVQDREEVRQSVVDDFNSMLGVVYALLALAIVIALVGIGNTIALSVVERTRELGAAASRRDVPGAPAGHGPLGGRADRGLRHGARAADRPGHRAGPGLRDQGVGDRDRRDRRAGRPAGGDRGAGGRQRRGRGAAAGPPGGQARRAGRGLEHLRPGSPRQRSGRGAVEVLERPRGRRAALSLVARALRPRAVRRLGRTGEPEEAELADLHARPQLDRQGGHVGQLERHVAGEAGVDEARGRVGEQPEPAEAAVVGRDVALADEEHPVGGVDLDAPDRHRGDRASRDDRRGGRARAHRS